MTDPYDWQALYPPGVHRDFRVPDAFLWHAVGASARQAPDSVAIRCGDRAIPYGALWRQIQESAASLGTLAGRRVLLWMRNRPEFVVWYHGALRAGGVVVAASPLLTTSEIEEIVADAEPSVAVLDDGLAAQWPRDLRCPAQVVGAPAASHRWEEAADDRCPAPNGNAVLQYTSGTTGGLKAAQMSHVNLLSNALQNNAWFGWSARDVVLGALPLCHTWGMGCVMNATLLAGATMVLLESFDPDTALAAIEERGVTIVYGSATMFHRLLDAAGPRAAGVFRSVRYVKAGAMIVGGDLPARWAAAVPHAPMVLGYGLTEAAPEVTNNPPHARRSGTVGIPLSGTHVRQCSPDEPEREVPRGGEGEIQVRGPQVTRGCWRRPDATSAALLPGGWLRTGDLGRFDEAGYLVIVDRLKDLIKFRGYSVAPAEIERAILAHAAVAEACVVGVVDRVDGEVPVAFVRLRPGAAVTGPELAAHLAPRLAPFKLPRSFRFVGDIPKNAVGKPLRRVLRARAGE